MVNVFIIHGAYGNPDENWFPWLKSKLEELACKVIMPKFPTPDNQTLDSWMSVFSDYEQFIDEDSIMVGHSLGPAFILSVIEKLDKPIGSAFLVSGFLGLLNNEEFDSINKTFVEREFNWEKIRGNCRKFFVLNSDNDPYVPLERGKQLADNLGSELIVVKNAGHINAGSGYKEFDLLLDMIKKEL